MPAYGAALSPAETTALVRFLKTLHPSYQPASEDASRQVVGQGGVPGNSTVERGGGQTPVR
jgi:ubiquinol-cytochrome c reductase cytochrome b subunit